MGDDSIATLDTLYQIVAGGTCIQGGTSRSFAMDVNVSRDARASGWKRTEHRNVCRSSTRQLALLGFY
jgi:hypothetical protein